MAGTSGRLHRTEDGAWSGQMMSSLGQLTRKKERRFAVLSSTY